MSKVKKRKKIFIWIVSNKNESSKRIGIATEAAFCKQVLSVNSSMVIIPKNELEKTKEENRSKMQSMVEIFEP